MLSSTLSLPLEGDQELAANAWLVVVGEAGVGLELELPPHQFGSCPFLSEDVIHDKHSTTGISTYNPTSQFLK